MDQQLLGAKERRLLLKIARRAIEAECRGIPGETPRVVEPALEQHRGAFVTLHKHGRLRGCIGTFAADKPLHEVVADMAVSAAFHDPRFRPLKASELSEIDLEISALTPMEQISDVNQIKVGVHGIYIVNGPFHGVLLPQVATEYGWDRMTFLDQTCMKAGLRPGCWKDPSTRVFIFSAEVFGENGREVNERP